MGTWKVHKFYLWPFYHHFWPFFRHLHIYPSQNLGADDHFEGLNMSKFQLDQNLWQKSKKCLTCVFFNFGRKKKFQKLPILNHLWAFFGTYMDTFHKTEIQTVILRCLECLNLNWMTLKSYFNAWRCIISVVKYRSKFWHLRKKPAGIFSIFSILPRHIYAQTKNWNEICYSYLTC